MQIKKILASFVRLGRDVTVRGAKIAGKAVSSHVGETIGFLATGMAGLYLFAPDTLSTITGGLSLVVSNALGSRPINPPFLQGSTVGELLMAGVGIAVSTIVPEISPMKEELKPGSPEAKAHINRTAIRTGLNQLLLTGLFCRSCMELGSKMEQDPIFDGSFGPLGRAFFGFVFGAIPHFMMIAPIGGLSLLVARGVIESHKEPLATTGGKAEGEKEDAATIPPVQTSPQEAGTAGRYPSLPLAGRSRYAGLVLGTPRGKSRVLRAFSR